MTELSYRNSGVDLELYEQSMQKLPELMRRTHTPGVMELPGGFAGLFHLAARQQWQDPVLVSGSDGVGTKIKVAIGAERFDSIGIDLVAMCVNDCLCVGATPLFFLDYIAMGKDNPELLEQLVRGVSEGCTRAGAALLGGETAIMPDLYAAGDFDMAGFCVGAAERSELILGTERIQPGDVLLGVPASGFHSNGYSLIRKVVFEHAGLSMSDTLSGSELTVADILLTPTRIYASEVSRTFEAVGNAAVHGIAHITGGGIAENLSRVLPENVSAVIEQSSWKVPHEFQWLQGLGNIRHDEMYRVFNMGLGLILVVEPDQAEAARAALSCEQYPAILLGTVVSRAAGGPGVVINGRPTD
jgi:phosphoribosylformylglycinamidine cyclo-ligase